MQDKLQELTQKIYQEGISKGKEEAQRIREDAEKEAGNIVSQAKKEAEKILADAEKKSREQKENMTSELRLSAKQAINALKQEISDLLQTEAIRNSAGTSFDDQKFINEIITLMVKNWDPKAGNIDLTTLVPAKKQKEVEDYFNTKAKALLDKGLTLKFSEEMEKGFEIGPKDGSYSISFTDEDFEAFLKEFLSPRMLNLLFQQEEKQ